MSEGEINIIPRVGYSFRLPLMKKEMLALLAIVLFAASTSGCFDIYTARETFFPTEDREIVMVEGGTIADVWYNFTGPYSYNGYEVAPYEEHLEIDNFHIGEGGGNLYLWIQVHFGPDTSSTVKLNRFLNVTLFHINDEGEKIEKARKSYSPPPDTDQFDKSEWVGNIEDPEEGLWSLRVFGKGTASENYYDWFHVSVNGNYPDTSYNHDAPG